MRRSSTNFGPAIGPWLQLDDFGLSVTCHLWLSTVVSKSWSRKQRSITEISPQDAAAKLNSGEAIVVDVRDKDEWDEGHIPGATHMSRGTIELDIEEKVADQNATIICHCGGGGRSALAAETLQKMGYKNVRSMAASRVGNRRGCWA